MEKALNPLRPKVRNRIRKVITRLYEQSNPRHIPSIEVVCRLSSAPAAACAGVLREWCDQLPLPPSEADRVQATDWSRKVSDLVAKRKIAFVSLAKAAAACEAGNADTDELLNDLVIAFDVQAEKLRAADARAAQLEITVSAASIARREDDEVKKRLAIIAKEFCLALSGDDTLDAMAEAHSVALSAVHDSAQALFAKIESQRNERNIFRARWAETSTAQASTVPVAAAGKAESGVAAASTEMPGNATTDPIRSG